MPATQARNGILLYLASGLARRSIGNVENIAILLCLNPPLFDHQSRDRKGATGVISTRLHGSLPYGRGSDRGLRQSIAIPLCGLETLPRPAAPPPKKIKNQK
ncbi:MAG: hypothetical protein FWD61_06325 [Phycisphaerales bacterium]|nr:hypothetical protein [Phycisphaerales bacterium]